MESFTPHGILDLHENLAVFCLISAFYLNFLLKYRIFLLLIQRWIFLRLRISRRIGPL